MIFAKCFRTTLLDLTTASVYETSDNSTLKVYFLLLFQGSVPGMEPETDPVQYILLGMVGGLVIVLAILTTSLMCARRK